MIIADSFFDEPPRSFSTMHTLGPRHTPTPRYVGSSSRFRPAMITYPSNRMITLCVTVISGLH